VTTSYPYIRQLRWAQKFALFNREEMMDRVRDCFEAWVAGAVVPSEQVTSWRAWATGSLNSSPHGAGREYGRKHAERIFTYEKLVESMAGIEWSGSRAFLDGIPSADKDIDVVINDARGLVEVRHTLRQIVNVKGD